MLRQHRHLLDSFTFDYTPEVAADGTVTVGLSQCTAEHQLIHFAVWLFRQLQIVGSFPAVEMDKYEANLS